MAGKVLESEPATVQWRWHYNLPALVLAVTVALIPLVVPGNDRERLRLLLLVAACGILLVVDNLGELFFASLAASIAIGLLVDRRRRGDRSEQSRQPTAADVGS